MISNHSYGLFFRLMAVFVLSAVSLTMSAAVPSPSAASDEGTVTNNVATTQSLYDFSPYTAENMLELFAKALDEGRNVPTDAEFLAAGYLPTDIAFIRSHVKKAPILDRTDRLDKLTYKDRELFLNFPCATEENKQGGYPSGKFNTDCFSMWQYTNLYGAWNHSFFQCPAAWVDAAHRNGTDMLSGMNFFESWNVGDDAWIKFCTTCNADGSFRYVKPLINALLYFGHDGINFNWEDDHYKNDSVVAFHKALYKEAERVGFDNFHVVMYTANTALSYSESDAIFGSKAKGKTTDLMLNYADGDFSTEMFASALYAEQLMGTSEGLYAGVHILTMDRSWDKISPRYLEIDEDDEESLAYLTHCGLCLWGEHGATWFWGRNEGKTDTLFQNNYQRLLERGFSGGNRNPADRPMPSSTGNNWQTTDGKAPLSTFCGLAEYIPERSAIQGNLPFVTHFNLGNGAFYAYKGKRTAGAWTNLSMQDYVPTYRWLVVKAGTDEVSTDIQPEFTHNDAYIGGSCLKLKGTATAEGTDIVLYKTALTTASQPTARIAVKTGLSGANASHLSLLVRLKGSTQWKEYAVGDVQGVVWNEKEIALTGIAQGDVIDRIALRVKGAGDDCNVMVGKIQLEDGTKTAPSALTDVVAEVREETKTSLSVKLAWNIAKEGQRADWQMLSNDEANVDHFEVFVRHGEEGRVSEVMRTASWATLVPHITFADADDYVYVGVRAVSTDLHTVSPVVWTRIPRSEQSALPDDKTAADLKFPAMDRGTAEEPEDLNGGVDAIDEASSAAVPTAKVSGRDRISVTHADRVWVYTANGRLVLQQVCSGTANLTLPISGSYVVRMQSGRVVRSVVVTL